MPVPDDLFDALLTLALSRRTDPLADFVLGQSRDALMPELAAIREALAVLALEAPAQAPSSALKGRILTSLAARRVKPRRAVLVVDMLNDHLHVGGPLEVPRARDIVPALAARLEVARREHLPIVYVNDQHDPEDSDLDTWGAHALRGTEGAAVWHELAPAPDDAVVTKPTYSGFARSRLGEVLDELGVDTLELTGCVTEIGLLVTATDAFQRGYEVEVPRAPQAGSGPGPEEVALGILRLLRPYGPARKALLAARAEAQAP